MQQLVQRYMGEPRERRRRLVLFVAAVLILGFAPFDVYVDRGPVGAMLLLRAAWVALLLVLALAQPRLGASAWRRAVLLGVVASNAIFVGLVVLAGGLDTPHAIWLPVMPGASLMLAWDRFGAVALGAAVTLAGTLAMAAPDGGNLLVWGFLVAGSSGLAVGTSFAFFMVQRDEQQALAARDDARDQLVESERRRLQAERLAIAGRLASSVAHAVNSPLAAVKSNLHHLGSPDGLDPRRHEERREVVADSTAAVDHIARVVGALRIFSQSDWSAVPPASEVGPLVHHGLAAAAPLLAPGLALRADVEAGLPAVAVGEALLSQVILGLLLSAGGGDRHRAPRRVTVEARRAAGGVRLDVLDDGADLSPDALASRLDVLSAGWSPGRGVGPALARELLGLEGGRVEVANLAEGGVRHRLLLPAAAGGGLA